jgi:putative nucleotidyltransferase with HDIG domain
MNTPIVLTREAVMERCDQLPSFPATVAEILATLDDPEGNLRVLVRAINHDPLISARVLSVANMASVRGRRESEVSDIYTATSLVGMGRVRQIALVSSLGTFIGDLSLKGVPTSFWQHSVAVGVCCEELAIDSIAPVSTDTALVAGLLHDIGQLWLYSFYPSLYQSCRLPTDGQSMPVYEMERQNFGVDHATIGAWMAESWELPSAVVAAIAGHHWPVTSPYFNLVSLVHIGEVLCNALDLTGRAENSVTRVSEAAMRQLGLEWNDDIRSLFGRMEARSRHANTFFLQPETPPRSLVT